MDKRYQVFVSSTFEDLQAERQEVIQALLELDCIPSGMELFPAADEDQWSLIKSVIDDCDYYIVIVAGRYGSVDESGMSFTEREYRYALVSGQPIIGFLHRNPGNLPAKRTEESEDGKRRLGEFRELVQQKMCQFWESPADLGSKVSRSLIKLVKSHPAVGWVRADQVLSEDSAQELLALRKRVLELEEELEHSEANPPPGTDELAQGDDHYEVMLEFDRFSGQYDIGGTKTNGRTKMSWNKIFYVVSPLMIDEAKKHNLNVVLGESISTNASADLRKRFAGERLKNFLVVPESFHTVIVQLRALGLITKSVRNRSVKDTNTYWRLTPYGEHIMTGLRAIRKEQ